MKGIKIGLLLVAISLSIILISPLSAKAVALTNTGITAGDFATFAGASFAGPILTSFDFAPINAGGDGNVASQVFTGIGPATGLYVYVYDIFHFVTSSETNISGIALDFITNPALTPVVVGALGGITSFIIDGTGTGTLPLFPPLPGPPFIAGGPVVGPTAADWFAGTLSFADGTPWLIPGQYSGVFGTFSPIPPGIVIADIHDTGVTLSSPAVYSPVPEPATMLLLGSGLIGLAGFARRRFKK